MPNDAKLGLVAGMCIVLTVAVVYFRKEVVMPTDPAAAVNAPGVPAGSARVVKGKTTSFPSEVTAPVSGQPGAIVPDPQSPPAPR